MPHKISAQFVCPSPKVSNIWKKLSLGVRSPWVHVIVQYYNYSFIQYTSDERLRLCPGGNWTARWLDSRIYRAGPKVHVREVYIMLHCCTSNSKMGSKHSIDDFSKKLFSAPKISSFGLFRCFFQNLKFLNILKWSTSFFWNYVITSIIQEIVFSAYTWRSTRIRNNAD
jgi:hypothetical protein